MLDQQDFEVIREIFRREISGTNELISTLDARTSNIEHKALSLQQDVSILRQDTSTLKQDVSTLKQNVNILTQDMTESKEWQSKIGTKVDQIHDLVKFNIEITSSHDNKLIRISQKLNRLDEAVKRKKSA